MKRLIARGRGFPSAEAGAIAAEFGLVISVLIVILMGCYESGRYILLHQKLDRASTSVADLIAQASGMSMSILNDTYAAGVEQTLPFDLAGEGRIIVSSVYNQAGTAKVQWQCAGGGAFTSGTSTIGAEGATATMPASFAVGLGENVVVAEVLYDYHPFLFNGIFKPSVFRHTTVTRPRGLLLTEDPGC